MGALILLPVITFLTGLIIMFISNGIKIYSPIILILIIADIICIYQSMKLLKLSNLGKLNKNKITSKQYPAEFEELYKKIFLKNNSEIEKLRIKVRNISALYLLFLVLTFLFVIFGIFIVPFILNSLDIYINGIIYHTLFLLGAYICGYRSLMLFGKYKKEIPIYKNSFKENVISKIVPLVNSNLLYFNGNDIAINIEPEYRASGFDGYDYNSFKIDDYIQGNIEDDLILRMADVIVKNIIQTKNGESSEDIFNGIFVMVNSGDTDDKEKDNNKIVTIYSNVYSINPDTKVEVESEEFNKYFLVSTNDKIYALQILTADVINILLTYKKVYDLDFEIKIRGARTYIRFHIDNMFEPKIFKEALNKDDIYIYYNVLKFIIDFSKELNKVIKETSL